ncbi:hypothetical protein ABZ446_44845 [Streptomyces sp. NPDC005813]|uniref:hypothetical protein n=1 Tax=Streptomyces sp. NPDC005813 TaxID=3155592 RepID=UPI0034009225
MNGLVTPGDEGRYVDVDELLKLTAPQRWDPVDGPEDAVEPVSEEDGPHDSPDQRVQSDQVLNERRNHDNC